MTLLVASVLDAFTGCGSPPNGNGSSTDTDTDSDTDSDVDTDIDTDTDVDSDSIFFKWHTFYHGRPDKVSLDQNGDLVVVGYSDLSWLGPNGESPINEHSGTDDIFVLKLGSDGEYKWHTFFGGTDLDWGSSLAFDEAGNIYVSGESKNAWNGPGGQPPKGAYSGAKDAVLIKVSSTGNYIWHIFFGCLGYDSASEVVESGGNFYLLGSSQGEWTGPFGESPVTFPGGGYDGFIVKVTAEGEYVWHGFHGGTGTEIARSMAVNGQGEITATGTSENGHYDSWVGPGGESPLCPYAGKKDIYVSKMGPDGQYILHTFLGGHDYDYGEDAWTNSSGDFLVSGTTALPWSGSAGESPVNPPSGATESFIFQLDMSGEYRWHTFFGGNTYDGSYAVRTDSSGNVFAAGYSDSSWAGSNGEPTQVPFKGDFDAVLYKTDSSGSYIWHAYFGGETSEDYGKSVAVDENGDIFFVGFSSEPWNGPEGQAPLNSHSNQGMNTFIVAASDPGGTTDVDTDADSDSDTDSVPDIDEWICNPAYYGANDGCDCGCNMEDPDCNATGGCSPPFCYEETCVFCHGPDGQTMPCIPPGPGGTCPEGDIDETDSIACMTSEDCAIYPEDYYSIELEYLCNDPEDVCCLQICDT